MGLDVIGAGFGRTGTLSLKIALEKLGFGPCYHMLEVFGNEGHVEAWSAATDGESVDWEKLFTDYRSAVDWPASRFWRELAGQFPQAKLILSVRDAGRWYESVRATIEPAMRRELSHATPPLLRAQQAMARKLVLDGVFEGRIDDREFAIGVYERNSRDVQASIDPSRLLVYEAGQGWEPLCRFLGVPVPGDDFPRSNDTASFRERMELGS